MSLVTSQEPIADIARRINARIFALKGTLTLSLANNAIGDFNALVTLPAKNNQAKLFIDSQIVTYGGTALKAAIDSVYNGDISIANLQSFLTAIDDLSTTIVNNSDLLVMTFNATTLQPEYVTPVLTTPLNALQAKINAALAFLD